MSKKLANIGVLVGALLALAAVVVMVSGVESAEKGKIALDVVILFGGLLMVFESLAVQYRGMPTNMLPKNGDFVFEATPAIENQTAEKTIGGETVFYLPKEAVSLLMQLSPKGKEGRKGNIKTYRVVCKNLVPGNELTHQELFSRLHSAQKGDVLRVLYGVMYFQKR